MLSTNQFTPDALSASIELCGTPVQYTRWNGSRNVILSGKVMAVHTFIPRRSVEPVSEYFVIPDKDCTNLTFHLVDESDIVGVVERCPRCNNHGYISISGDNDTPCPLCDDTETSVPF